MKVKVLISQSCPALCDPKDWSLPDSSIPGILQAILQPRSGLPFPSAGDFPDPGTKAGSSALQADSLLFEPKLWFTYALKYALILHIKIKTNFHLLNIFACYIPDTMNTVNYLPSRN